MLRFVPLGVGDAFSALLGFPLAFANGRRRQLVSNWPKKSSTSDIGIHQ